MVHSEWETVDLPHHLEYSRLLAGELGAWVVTRMSLLGLFLLQADTWVRGQGDHFVESGMAALIYLYSAQRRDYLKKKRQQL